MNQICGMCGNYDDKSENDLCLPDGKEVSPSELGEYYIVGGYGNDKYVLSIYPRTL